MCELSDFKFFKEHQLVNFDPNTGVLDVTKKRRVKKDGSLYPIAIFENIGSLNKDGYVRVHCNRNLRMKHRLIYWLVYGVLPSEGYEIDHIDSNRSNNAIQNLRIVTKSINNSNCNNRKFGSHLTKEQVITICELLATTDLSDTEIAKRVGRSRATVRDIKKRRSRTKISQDYIWSHRE